MAKRAPKRVAKVSRSFTIPSHDGVVDIRSEEWPKRWRIFVEAFGGPKLAAEELCVHYQSLWRWALKGDEPPPIAQKLIRILAAQKGVPSPV